MMPDAIVDKVHYFHDSDEETGNHVLHCRLILKKLHPADREKELIVVNPKPCMDAMVGVCLSISEKEVRVAGRVFANRLSFRKIQLTDKPKPNN